MLVEVLRFPKALWACRVAVPSYVLFSTLMQALSSQQGAGVISHETVGRSAHLIPCLLFFKVFIEGLAVGRFNKATSIVTMLPWSGTILAP